MVGQFQHVSRRLGALANFRALLIFSALLAVIASLQGVMLGSKTFAGGGGSAVYALQQLCDLPAIACSPDGGAGLVLTLAR